MDYSQKKLIEHIKAGHFSEEATSPQQHIETVISNVFLFEDTVYKVYKNDNDFFNTNFKDISEKKARFDFTVEDFAWNNTLSPTIYLEIIGVRVKDTLVVTCPLEEAEEIVMVMNRVKTTDFLHEKLLQGSVTEEIAFHIGEQFGSSVARVQKPVTNRNYYDDSINRLQDLREWFTFAKDDVSQEEITRYCDFLTNFLEQHKDTFEKLSSQMTKDGDIHSHNAVLSGSEFHLLDTFPPKEEWGNGHPAIAFYRLGTDIRVFGGSPLLFEAFVKGYEKSRGAFSRELEPFYTIYASGIMLSYQYHLAKSDPREMEGAKLYHQFMQKYFEENCIPS
jgi:aminoglycoside phosphotransferase family enzyme